MSSLTFSSALSECLFFPKTNTSWLEFNRLNALRQFIKQDLYMLINTSEVTNWPKFQEMCRLNFSSPKLSASQSHCASCWMRSMANVLRLSHRPYEGYFECLSLFRFSLKWHNRAMTSLREKGKRKKRKLNFRSVVHRNAIWGHPKKQDIEIEFSFVLKMKLGNSIFSFWVQVHPESRLLCYWFMAWQCCPSVEDN